MKGLFELLLLLCLCGCDSSKKDITKLEYNQTNSGDSYICVTDSGFIFKAPLDEGYKYFEYSINKDEIKMYSDSLYDLACMACIFYPTEFYVNHLGSFRNRANCELKPTGEIVNNRYVYSVNLSSFNSPEYRIHLKAIEFSINGREFDIKLDSTEIRNLLPIFENTLYTAKGL